MDQDHTGVTEKAARLLERLTAIYTAYTSQGESQPKPKFSGITRLFRKWFSGLDPTAADPAHQAFLDDAGETAASLAGALKALSRYNTAESMDYAANAADVMMAPKPLREKTTEEWYLTVAEYHIAPILPYLSISKLRQVREAMLKSTPKRLMYPKQRELFDLVEKLIKDNTQKA